MVLRFLLSILILVLYPMGHSSGNEYRGTIIDAHTQWGCEFSPEVVLNAIEQESVAHTLLSYRCNKKGDDPLQSHAKLLELVEKLGDRASMLISMKYKNRDLNKTLEVTDEAYFEKSIGYSEIIVQHALHDNENLKLTKARTNTLESKKIVQAIEFISKKEVPIILHVELNDFEEQSSLTISSLKKILERYPNRNFVLIHMGQASAAEARDLIEQHKNIFFMMSQADAFPVIGIRRLKKRGQKAQFGWINMFTDPPKEIGRGWIFEYIENFTWRPKWKALVSDHPSRFMFATENIWERHWNRRYGVQLQLWRKAFSLLPPEAAIQVACKNAVSLWKLNISCVLK